MPAAAREPVEWLELARAIGRDPKDGTARRLRKRLRSEGALAQLEDGRWQADGGASGADAPGTPETGSTEASSTRVPRCHEPGGVGTVAPGNAVGNGRPAWLDSPALPAAERAGLEAAQALVDAGDAGWVEGPLPPGTEVWDFAKGWT
jgi:hypothetical protein